MFFFCFFLIYTHLLIINVERWRHCYAICSLPVGLECSGWPTTSPKVHITQTYLIPPPTFLLNLVCFKWSHCNTVACLQVRHSGSTLGLGHCGAFSTHFIMFIKEIYDPSDLAHRGWDKKKNRENARMGQRSPVHHSQRMSHDDHWHFYVSRADSLLSLSGWWTLKWETMWSWMLRWKINSP